MTQPPLPGCETPREHRNVRETSKIQYAVARDEFEGRRGDVLRWLSAYFNLKQVSPTSGELAKYAETRCLSPNWDWLLLYVRRGLSACKETGVIEPVPNGERHCKITGNLCETWRVTMRGTSPNR